MSIMEHKGIYGDIVHTIYLKDKKTRNEKNVYCTRFPFSG